MRLGFAGGVLAVIAVILLITGYSSLFQVYQTRQALVVRLGNPLRVVTDPGLHVKMPLLDTVIYVDKRILDLENSSQEVIAADQKQLMVDAFARYRVVDALRFYQTVGTVDGANSRLSPFLNSALRAALGEATHTQVVRDQREQLMARVRDQLDREAKQFGIEVVDVRIRRADLPEQNSQAVYTRMKTEREREAQEFRSQGTQKAQEIRARADRDATVTVAEASRRAAKATPSATASLPMPTTRIRTSSPSIARCRPTTPACSRAIPGSWCGPTRISSASSSIRTASRAPTPLRRPRARPRPQRRARPVEHATHAALSGPGAPCPTFSSPSVSSS
jgi:membrane protease subunit HflC